MGMRGMFFLYFFFKKIQDSSVTHDRPGEQHQEPWYSAHTHPVDHKKRVIIKSATLLLHSYVPCQMEKEDDSRGLKRRRFKRLCRAG
jgi:hypothetical protein